MRARARVARAGACATGLAIVLAASPARPQGLYGSLSAQFQRVEENRLELLPDGSWRARAVSREWWVQTYEVNHQAQPRPDLLLQSNFRLTDLSYVNLKDGSRTPQGTLRLNHQWFGMQGSYRPTTTTSAIGPQGFGGTADTARALTLTARTQETTLMGNVALPRLPRLDLSWVRRHRNADPTSPEEASVNRQARLAYDRGALSVFGSWGDLQRELGPASASGGVQRNATAGAALRFAPSPKTSLHLQADLGDTRTRQVGGRVAGSRTVGAGADGDYRPNAATTGSLHYLYRRAHVGDGFRSAIGDHDGSMLVDYNPARSLRLTGGGGIRTERQTGDEKMLRYLTAVVSAEGRVRSGWTGVASGSHVTNWDPFRGTYSVESARAGSRWHVWRGLDLDGQMLISANGDTANRDQRTTSELVGRIQATPLRSVILGLSARTYNVGRSLSDAAGRSRSTTVDLRWKPMPMVEMVGSHASSGALPGNNPRVTTDAATLRWSPSAKMQVTASWSRSQEARTTALADQLVGRQLASARVLTALSRNLTLNAGSSVAEPGTAREARQMDALLSWTFGR